MSILVLALAIAMGFFYWRLSRMATKEQFDQLAKRLDEFKTNVSETLQRNNSTIIALKQQVLDFLNNAGINATTENAIAAQFDEIITAGENMLKAFEEATEAPAKAPVKTEAAAQD